jgi:hypothetical protein
MTLPGTSVHKGKKGRVPLQKHCVRCGCRETHLGSDHKLHVPKPPGLEQVPEQQSSLTRQVAPTGPQQVPFALQNPLKQHVSPAAQEPPG